MVAVIEGVPALAYGVRGLLFISNHFGLSLRLGHARIQPAQYGKKVTAAAARARRIDLQRNPQLGRIEFARGKREARRHYPDHVTGIAVQTDVAADDAGVAAEGPLPQPIGNHSSQGNIRPVIVGRRDTAQNRMHAEHREHAAADVRRGGPHGFGGARQIHSAVDPTLDRGERLRVAFEIEEFRRRNPKVPQPAVWEVRKFREDTDQAAGLCIRQRTEQYGVDHAENCGSSADAQRQARDRGGSEAGIPGKEPDGVANILDKRRHVTS